MLDVDFFLIKMPLVIAMEKGSDDLQNELIDFGNNSACKTCS